jgi:hypothetical protein
VHRRRPPGLLADLAPGRPVGPPVRGFAISRSPLQIVGAYLALPVHLRHRPIPTGGRTPADELVCQLRLLDEYLSITSERVFSSHTRDIADLSEDPERRNRHAPSELESGA